MNFVKRTIQDIGEFFSRDILSFSILIFLGIFLVNHLVSAESLAKTPHRSVLKMRPRKFIDDRASGSLSKQLDFHNEKSKKNWQVNLGLSASQKAINDGSQKNQNNNSYSLSSESSFKFSNEMSLKALLNYNSYSKNELQNDLSDLLLSFYFLKSKLNSNLNLSTYLLSTVPVSKDSRQRQQMNFGLGFGTGLSTQRMTSSGAFSAAGSISIQKYFHKYETALNNVVNVSYASNQQVSLGWGYGQVGLFALFMHNNSWNYTDSMKESFFHLQGISWNVNTNLSFSAGHSNSGNVLSPNQEDIEIRLIDDNRSTLFLSTNYIF